MEKTVRFDYKRSTKGTYVYQETREEDKPMVIGTLYVRQHVLGTTPPEKVIVTLVVPE